MPLHEFTPDYRGIHVTRSLVFRVVFCRLLFVPLHLAIVLSVLLRFTASVYSWYLQTCLLWQVFLF